MRHDLLSLELFVAVAECGNVTRAAGRKHLAVSAVSKRIAELEDLTGSPLLVRQARGVRLTAAGQSLLHHARDVLRAVHGLEEELGRYASGMKGHVRLHAIASALTQWLPGELQSFLRDHPDVQVSLEERTGKAVLRAVADGSADIGIVAGAGQGSGLAVFPYRRDRLHLGVPAGHPLARRKRVAFAEALGHAFVGPLAESSLLVLMQDAARAAGRPLRQQIQVSSFDVMCRMVETGLGVTLLPADVLAPYARDGRLRTVAVTDAWAERRLSIVAREREALSHVARALVAHLQAPATDVG